ncbi:MAG: methyltransferase domain-containing protein [Candidatus Thermoplasmatota archaeon]|nr:methyltransferase domain-containing protein [Candidatus Thermoplasmatota archaeon]
MNDPDRDRIAKLNRKETNVSAPGKLMNSKKWDDSYRSGLYLKQWECSYPSQELCAALSILNMSRASKILDLGCGTGTEAIFMASLGYEVTGVDISQEALKIAAVKSGKQGIPVNWIQADAANLPIPDDSVDFISDRGCLHIIPEVEQKKYAKETTRILKQGGYLLIRGSAQQIGEEFFPISRKTLDILFPSPMYTRGAIIPFTMVSDSGKMTGNIAFLQKTGDGKY